MMSDNVFLTSESFTCMILYDYPRISALHSNGCKTKYQILEVTQARLPSLVRVLVLCQ